MDARKPDRRTVLKGAVLALASGTAAPVPCGRPGYERRRPPGRADRHDQARPLQPVRRAHRRRHLRRHLGRPRLEDAQHRRHPPRLWSSTSAGSARSSSAGRAAVSPTSITGATASARASKRPRRFGRWREETESNHFGTHEFMRFCRLCGVEPYFAANVGTGSAEEFQQWVEYCNAPAGSTTLADERVAQRRPRAVRRPLLGRRQRELGLRRQVHPRGLLPRVPQVHRMGPGYGVAALPDRRRAERQRRRLDPPVLREVGRLRPRPDPGLGAALLLRHDRPRPQVHRRPVVRDAPQGQPDGAADRRPVGGRSASSTGSTRSSSSSTSGAAGIPRGPRSTRGTCSSRWAAFATPWSPR